MARLLFGESASQLTALQVVQIGAALATLGGGGGGFNPLAKMQKTLGLDRLTVGSGPSTGTTRANQTELRLQRRSGPLCVQSRLRRGEGKHHRRESTRGRRGPHQAPEAADSTGQWPATTTQGTTPENDPGSSVGLAYQFEY